MTSTIKFREDVGNGPTPLVRELTAREKLVAEKYERMQKNQVAGKPIRVMNELVRGGLGRHYPTSASLRDAIDSYFVEVPPPHTVGGLALYLDCCTSTLRNNDLPEDYQRELARARLRLADEFEGELRGPNSRVTGGFASLWFRNVVGWVDRCDIAHTGAVGVNVVCFADAAEGSRLTIEDVPRALPAGEVIDVEPELDRGAE